MAEDASRSTGEKCTRNPSGCASVHESVYWRATIKFKETSKYPILLPELRHQAKSAAGTTH